MAEDDFGLKFTLESGETCTFHALPIRIGRDPSNEIVLAHATVSAFHAQVFYDDLLNDICIQDLDSTNGLFINDLPTRKNVLMDGVKIGLGQAGLIFRDTGYIHSV
ncbi:MAG: FHA domain-containing protein [Chloroflexota bacterium]